MHLFNLNLHIIFNPLYHLQWASGEARARLALQAEGKLDKPVFGVHYDTPENKYDFESVSPDNPFNEDDGEFMLWISVLFFREMYYDAHFWYLLLCVNVDDDDDDDEDDEEEGEDEDDDE